MLKMNQDCTMIFNTGLAACVNMMSKETQNLASFSHKGQNLQVCAL